MTAACSHAPTPAGSAAAEQARRAHEQARRAHATGEPLPSPCVGVCRLHPDTGLCTGCRRTLAEIGAWSSMDERQKWAVWQSVLQRAGEPPPAEPGART